MTNCCDTCTAKEKCPFYEAGADKCVYEVLAETAKKPLKKIKKNLLTNPRKCATIQSERERKNQKMNKELKPYRQKMDDEELQMYLHFKKRGGKSPLKKGKGSYNRQKMKMEEMEE